jgi:hypothetical protein
MRVVLFPESSGVRARPRVAFNPRAWGALAQDNKRLQLVIEGRRYFELVLRVVVEMRSSPVSFGAPMASTSLPV